MDALSTVNEARPMERRDFGSRGGGMVVAVAEAAVVAVAVAEAVVAAADTNAVLRFTHLGFIRNRKDGYIGIRLFFRLPAINFLRTSYCPSDAVSSSFSSSRSSSQSGRGCGPGRISAISGST